jgi:LmbE family N-acetylglucosaminyl deacetylase
MSSLRTLAVTPPSVHARAWSDRLDAAVPFDLDGLGLDRGDAVLAVVAHPDDEVLAMGGVLATLAADGIDVHVVSLTSGEAALDHVGVRVPDLARRRGIELHQASRRLGITTASAMSWPDSRLGEFDDETADFVEDVVVQRGARRVLTLWGNDPHPDHQAASRAARDAGTRRGVPVTELLLWTVHWTDPDTVADDVRPVDLANGALRRRREALRVYVSQTTPLADYLEPVLPAAVTGWTRECVVA